MASITQAWRFQEWKIRRIKMNKLEELKQKYKELGEEIEKLEKQGKVWTPAEQEKYWIINTNGEVDWQYWGNDDYDKPRYQLGDCFRTKEEAEAVVEKLKIYTQLKRLAKEINTEPIDWNNEVQHKYEIVYNASTNCLLQLHEANMCTIGQIYCTNFKFLEIAKERIGEENLLKLFKE